MQDRPTFDELLAAIENFLDSEIVPNVPGSRGFHARVSANAIRIIRRELAMEDEHLSAEWRGLDTILGAEPLPADRASLRSELLKRNRALCERIRGGDADEGPFAEQVIAHTRAVVADKLRVQHVEVAAEPAAEENPVEPHALQRFGIEKIPLLAAREPRVERAPQ